MRGDFISQIPRKRSNTDPKMPQISLFDIVKMTKKRAKTSYFSPFLPDFGAVVRSEATE